VFKTGDVVCLRCGGPDMVISAIEPTDKTLIVLYFKAGECRKIYDLDPKAVELVSERKVV
jgi:uncharacterized protein YodC (DUF2158 family)